MFFDAAPAIIQAAEPWEIEAHRKLTQLGVPRNMRRAVVAELKRLQSIPSKLIRPSLQDLDRYAGTKLALVPGIMGLPLVQASTAKVLTYRTAAKLTSSTSSPSFGSIDIGASSSDRRVIVLYWGATAGGAGAVSVNSATIDGVSATITINNAAGSGTTAAIIIANCPSGNTSATIAFSLSGNNARHSIGVFHSTGLTSNTANATQSSTADPASMSLATLSAGFAVALAGSNAGSGGSYTWADVTEQYEDIVDGSLYSGGMNAATTGATLTITATRTGVVLTPNAVAASW
jgi:hypothetical protein